MTFSPPRKNAEEQLLCTVTAGCDEPATQQGEYPCGGCNTVAAQHAETLEKLTAERDGHEQAAELIRRELARRADAGEDARLSAVEEVAVRLGADKVKELGATIHEVAAAHAAVLEEHTHPVFGCEKHEGRLPKAGGVAADPHG